MDMKFGCTAALLSGVASFLASPAYAEQSDQNAQTAASASTGDVSTGEIVVTAQKRAESIQKVPAAVTAITAAGLKQSGTTNVFGLMNMVPALHVESAYGEAEPRFNLRGIGNDEFSPSATPAVGVYVDEVYQNNVLGGAAQFFDLDHVEVLKGPQGTLWGKNTTAGVVSLSSKRPTDHLEGYVHSEIGNYGRKTFDGAISGPLIEGVLDARASFYTNSYNGYFFNRHTGEDAGGSDAYGVRLQLLWTPSDDFDLLLKYARSHLSQEAVYSHKSLLSGGVDGRGYQDPGDPFTLDIQPVPKGRDQTDAITSIAHWRFGDGYEVTNIAAYQQTRSLNFTDDDSAPYVYENSTLYGRPKQFSNELRITSPSNRFLSWIVGAYYLRETLTGNTNVWDPEYNPYGTSYPAFDQTSRSLAGFGNVTLHVSEPFSVSGGVRVTNEKKRTHVTGGYYNCPDSEWFNIAACTLTQSYLDARGRLSNTVVTWDGNAKYDFGNGIVYARVARGFRAGSFQNLYYSSLPLTILKPETLTSFEVGFKSYLFDRKLRLNGDIFHYQYKNLQVQQLQNLQSILTNTTAKVDGLELELDARPIPQLNFGGELALLNPRYGNFPAATTESSATGSTDLSGKQLAKAAKRTAHVYASWTVGVESDHPITLRSDWNYSSRVNLRPEFANIDTLPLQPGISRSALRSAMVQDGYWLGNVSVSVQISRALSVTGFVRNITDKAYKTTAFTRYDGNTNAAGINYGAPRTYGASAEFRF